MVDEAADVARNDTNHSRAEINKETAAIDGASTSSSLEVLALERS